MFLRRKIRKDLCERFRAFLERVGPRILSLERDNYFGTSEHFSAKKRIVMRKTSIVRLTGRALLTYTVCKWVL